PPCSFLDALQRLSSCLGPHHPLECFAARGLAHAIISLLLTRFCRRSRILHSLSGCRVSARHSSARIVCSASITVIDASTNTIPKKESDSDCAPAALCTIPDGVKPPIQVWTAFHFHVRRNAQPPATMQ